MIVYREGAFSDSDGKKAYFELRVKAGGRFYVLMSNYVDIPATISNFLCWSIAKGIYMK